MIIIAAILIGLVLCLGLSHGQMVQPNVFKKSHSVSFQGQTNDWIIDYKLFRVGSDVEIEPKITYIGDDEKMLLSSLRYEIEDDKGGIIAEAFTLDKKGVYEGQRTNCMGCHYLSKVEEIEASIGLIDGGLLERVPLRRLQ